MFHVITPDPSKPFTIGRKESCDLRFGDLFVSREHAVIEKRASGWFLKSLTQNSVTKVNDADVTETALKDGDIIVIGVRMLRAALNGNEFSLLILDQKEDVNSISLSDGWTAFDVPGAGTAKAKVTGDKAEIQSVKKVMLENGDTVRIEQGEISFKDGRLMVAKANCGFDVCVKNLDVYAGKRKLLHDINFELPAGEILAIIGQSGQGKSTLLHLLEGMLSKGKDSEVRIGGVDYRERDIREHIAFMAQDPALRRDLTVEETILHGARITMDKREFAATARERFESFTELFGLSDRKNHRVQTLSGGELRRTALAAELMSNPGLIVLDEPLSGLDPYNTKILCSHLKQLAFIGHTIILTTHSYEALDIANKVLVLHKGGQGFYGTPQEAYRYFRSDNPAAILSNLDDDTAVRWKNAAEANTLISEKKYTDILFKKIHRKNSFLYGVSLSLKQCFRDRGKVVALFLQPIIIGFLFSQIFSPLSSLWIVAFALILCANWFALSLSIREIVQEKSILRNEFRKGQKILPVLASKSLLPVIAAFVQTLVVYAFVAFRMSLHSSPAALATAFACTVLPAVAIGLFVSSLSRNSGQANAFLPLLIIPQVALAGALVPLDQMQQIGKALSTVIWSRYNQKALLDTLLERQGDVADSLCALALAIGFYIFTAIVLFRSKKAK
ncbi:MAG: ATP-binding cassette domain-containing protein [Fibrobacter sp.]|nr:ATP-binding cassette domain-containing protein [Fibrobacter sp.]